MPDLQGSTSTTDHKGRHYELIKSRIHPVFQSTSLRNARADALSRPSRVEEVEIYLAYQTRLASRLGLPWQSEHMLYRNIAAVSDDAIEQAYATVLALEEGNGLLDAMLEQPFWEGYLHETHDLKFRSNDRAFDEKLRLLEQRREADEINEQAYSESINTLADEKLQLGRRLTRTLLDKHAL